MKTILVITLLLLLASSAMAQDEINSKGFRAGLNMSTWAGADGSPGAQTLTGFAFGFFFTLPTGPQLSIQPEFLYSMKGVKGSEGNLAVKFKTNYLEIPVLFKYNFPGSGTTKTSLYAGPSIAFLMSAKLEVSDGNNSGSIDAKELFKGMDFGLVLGLSVAFESGVNRAISIDGRFTMGMSKIMETDPDFGELDIKNSTISLLLGYSL